MLTLDITGTLGKTITPSHGIPDQELTSLRPSLKRHVEDMARERADGKHAWAEDPYRDQVIDDVQNAAKAVRALKPQTVVWVGIGGSSLGPKVLQEAFESPRTVEFLVLDTIDPASLQLALDVVDWENAIVVVASKSGDTLEPMSVFSLLWQQLRQAHGKDAAKRVIAVTDPTKGSLHAFCVAHGVRMLPIPPDVGGRYSIFTPVGLLPLALLGGDVDAFCNGARAMDEQCRQPTLEENPAARLAAAQFALDTKRGYRVRVIMPYGDRLKEIARWDQQLVAESLGKTEVHNPIPLAAIGTQDQHSLLQQWMAGPRMSWHVFIREEEKPRVYVPDDIGEPFTNLAGKTFGQLLDACYEGTSGALTAARRPHATITLTRIDEEHLGQLFFCLMAEVVLLGKLYRIDPYGQPAVEVGKQITKEILSRGRGEL